MIRTIAAIALAAEATTPPAAPAVPDPEPPLVVAILAHPDDEMPMAPALAALARAGHFVRLVYATSGDAGPGVSGMDKGEALGALRRGEADCAGKALGAREVVHMGRGDGTLAGQVMGQPGTQGTLAHALLDHVAGADLVLTWGPDGGYGHADHRVVSALTAQIAAGQPADTRPRVLYFGIAQGRATALPPIANWAETDPALLTASIAYSPADLAATHAAIQCHVSQFDAPTRAGMAAAFDAAIWQGKVDFRPAL
jgi:LmbE family N-acetylglucosaminyl deacetylase